MCRAFPKPVEHPLAQRRRQTERLTPRARVLTAVEHREPDRVPLDFWAVAEVQRSIQEYFGCASRDALLDFLGVDFRVAGMPRYVGPTLPASGGISQDIWGVRRQTVAFGAGSRRGSYEELSFSPLATMTSVSAIESYPGWPSPDWWDYSGIAADCRRYPDHCILAMGDRLDRTAQLKPAMYLRGVEQVLLDLALNPKVIDCLNERITGYFLECNRRIFATAAGGIDIFMMGDDFGSQTGPLLSSAMWQRFYAPGFRKYIELAHRHGIRVMHHTCGAVRPLIPLFIDCGLDILQSLQPRAAGMDLRELKREFGRDLVLQGGIDIQQTLPRGTPAEVRREVRERLEAAKSGGGYILCTAHNLQADTPAENVAALFEAAHEFGAY